MTIIEKIQNSLTPIVGEDNFQYAESEDLNVILDSARFPCAFSTLLDQGTVEDNLGRFSERVTIQVWFADLSEVGITGVENERILQPQKERALTWLATLRQSDELELQAVNRTARYYLHNSGLDVLVTAYVVDVTIKEKESYGACGK